MPLAKETWSLPLGVGGPFEKGCEIGPIARPDCPNEGSLAEAKLGPAGEYGDGEVVEVV
jgi:hypothetical protein